jgi:hypothetical protein
MEPKGMRNTMQVMRNVNEKPRLSSPPSNNPSVQSRFGSALSRQSVNSWEKGPNQSAAE